MSMKNLACLFLFFLCYCASAADGFLAVSNGVTRGGFAGGGGSQTPWTSDIDGNNKQLTNVASVSVNGTGTNYFGTNVNIAGTLNVGGNLTNTSGTRTFAHDTSHTVITNTATLTSSEWTAGSQKEWYNGSATMTIDKTNGAITMNGSLSLSTNAAFYPTFIKGWAMTNPAASYTQGGPAGVDTTLLTFQQTLYTITNAAGSGSPITVTLPSGLKKATWWGTNVTAFVVTNATMQWWTCRPGETNVYIEGGY